MINKFNIAKALFNKAEQVSNDNSYLLIAEGQKHESDPNETYIEEKVLYGSDDSVGSGWYPKGGRTYWDGRFAG